MGPKGNPQEQASRRGFLGIVLGFLGFCGLGGIGYTLAKFLSPTGSAGGENKAQIPSKELARWDSKVLLVGGKPVVVVRTGNEVMALSAVCTHLGCIVHFDPSLKLFVCPCHAAKYDTGGRVVSGPAPRPLPRVQVHEESGQIVVG